MILSMNWLKEYVDINVDPHQFSEDMTMSGSKVEGYAIEGNEISKVVVGKILSIEKHPDSDHLLICQVDAGTGETLQIVTGAQNVFAGALVPVALDGSTLCKGVKIKKGKLRGVVSNGMLCSLGELGLTTHDFPYAIENGIFILQEDCHIGQDIHEAIGLNDTTVEFEITSNRPDCLSMIGLAREAAVTYQKPLKISTPKEVGGTGDIHDLLQVTVENPQLCMRYSAAMFKNIKIEPSPRWMRERLRACGVRAVNNIVDITNYVMLEYGQPMHAFDYKYVKDGKIIVRNAKPGESIKTLDGVERALSPEMLVIADSEKPSAIGGVMGGEYSEINDDTNMIIFESACFLGSSVRTTAKKVGLRTESSSRYEKGLDPNACVKVLKRACELVVELGAGEPINGIIDVNNAHCEPVKIKLDADWINQFLGIHISKEQMVKILTDLECKVENDIITVPTFRADLQHKADIAEEIARFYGYNKIPTTVMKGVADGKLTDTQKFERLIHSTVLGLGLSEIYTYSFISPKYYDKIHLPKDSALRNSVTIMNPLGEDSSVMRTTAIPSMMEVLSRNYNNRNASAALYEIATEYIPQGENELPIEQNAITIGMYGAGCDYYKLKGIVEALLNNLSVYNIDVKAVTDNPTFHPGRCAVLTVNNEEIGVLGEIHPSVAENYTIAERCYVAKLSVNQLYKYAQPEKNYKPLPKFPATVRDIAVVCDDSLPAIEIEKTITKAVGKILESIELFDVYKGKQIAEGKKSLAYNITMRAWDRTLTDEEASKAIDNALKALSDIGATLRV